MQNITDHLQCLSIASTNPGMDDFEEFPTPSLDDELRGAIGKSPPKDVRLKDPLAINVDGERKELELEESLYRKQVELDIRAELLEAKVHSESRKMDEANSRFNQMISQVDSLSEDIDDFMDEYHPRDLSNSLEDIDVVITRIERLRSEFRTAHKELRMAYGERRYSNTFQGYYTQKLEDIKVFIGKVRDKRRSIRDLEDKAKDSLNRAHGRKLEFQD